LEEISIQTHAHGTEKKKIGLYVFEIICSCTVSDGFRAMGLLLIIGACGAQVQDVSSNLKPAQQDAKWGYIDGESHFVIPPQFDSANTFSQGLAVVEQNKRFGYIATDGHFVIQPKYYMAGPFKEGFAWVMTKKPFNLFGTGEYGMPLFGRFTYIDRTGKEIRQPFYAEHVSNFSEGLAAVRPGKAVGGCSERIGYLNTKGEWSIKPQFDDADDFSEGLAAVNRGAKCHMGGKWGYVDKEGDVALPFKYTFASQFKNGRACVEEEGEWKSIDNKGNGIAIANGKCVP
jgi:WG containing repeat